MTMKFVTKSDGTRVPFDKNKIVETCVRSGLDVKTCREVADIVERTLPDGASTHQIYDIVLDAMEKHDPRSAAMFGLREAIANIDSEAFELYAKSVLEANGWKCEWNQLIKGRSVEHQIDVLAHKGDESWIVECKRHFNPHRWCGLDVSLQVHSRLEDLRDGSIDQKNKYKLTGAWIFTNTKFSEHAKDYANAKGIRMTGWRSGEFGLERLVQEKNVWPVTMLKVDLMTKAKLIAAHVITVNDVLAAKRPIVQNWTDVVSQAKAMMR